MAEIFISYSRKSDRLVNDMESTLRTMGHRVWRDQHLSGGQDWWEHILEQIRSADVVIAAIDDHSVKSRAVLQELDYALDLGVHVLPVIVDGTGSQGDWPTRWRNKQFVDYRGQTASAVAQLSGSLANLGPRPDLPDPLPDPPKSPIVDLDPIRKALGGGHDLSEDVQKSILADLRDHLEDPAIGQTVQELLRKLSARGDTTKRLDQEITTLLASVASDASGPGQDGQNGSGTTTQQETGTETDGQNTDTNETVGTGNGTSEPPKKPPTRWDYVGYGGVGGFLLGVLSGEVAVGVVLGVFGAIIGLGISFIAATSPASKE